MSKKIKGVSPEWRILSKIYHIDIKGVSRLHGRAHNIIENEGITRDMYENKGKKF
jgi:hypothetical protein